MTSAAAPVPEFDVCGPLPTGVTVLEASAGTGKTFTIAALVARHVADGTKLEHLLVLTFTRMATGELRERVRERLVSAEAGLGRALVGVEPDPEEDRVLWLLAQGHEDEVRRRRQRLRTAVANFDAATISTTHGFCQQVLEQLGVAGDLDRDTALLEDTGDLLDEVVADLYVERFEGWGGAPPLTLDEVREVARLAVGNPLAPVEPADADPSTPPGLRRDLALAARRELERRKRRQRLLTYDDQLTRLRDTLAHPDRGPAACDRLRERYAVALVDEFQDTDRIQWEIMERAFGSGGASLVLIGDPKQAIYAFRGADVHAYLEAAGVADAEGDRATLGTNYRSDQGLLDAYDALFGDAHLGHREIAYRTVRASADHQGARLHGAPDDTPLRVRVVQRDGVVELTKTGYVSAPRAREHIAADLAADVARLLGSGARVEGEDGEEEVVAPGHLAVLVRKNVQAAMVRDALEAAGVPAVINGAGSVFATPAATAWLRLLEGLERPTSSTRVRAAALTAFIGWSAARIAEADEATWEDLHHTLHRWADVLRRRGVASLLETITRAEDLPARVLGRTDGERALTDLRHVGQLLHAAATADQLGVTALTSWLRRRIAESGADTSSEERSRRLDSDHDAVQVLTIHRSKGLEFPIVYYPYLWDPIRISDRKPVVFHNPADGERTLDVGLVGAAYRRNRELHVADDRGEDLRLAYVALTRARHQAVVWWAPSYDSRESSLCRLLLTRDDEGDVALSAGDTPSDAEVLDVLGDLVAASSGKVSVETVDPDPSGTWTAPSPAAGDLRAASFDRTLDTSWRRSSYSGITGGAREARVASEAEDAAPSDELMPTLPTAPATEEEEPLRAVPSPLAGVPGGAAFGKLVHRVLELTDFTAPSLADELHARLDELRSARLLDVGDPEVLAAGLAAAIATPLGPLAGGRALRDVPRADRLDELWFELPVAGGDDARGAVRVARIADLLAEHLPADDPLAGYVERLRAAAPLLQPELRGYLAGAIDLVLRMPGEDGDARYLVADHKTNWLGVEGEALSAFHYRPAALADAMQHAHYPLQALLYSAALHRYLRWRLPDYAPERHLGGVLYLFLRGMVGPDVPLVEGQPCGTFAWRPPAALVLALSDLLDGGAP
jgi:exodeoxyribonuclease V beta subunit